jgi:hypothetical protein
MVARMFHVCVRTILASDANMRAEGMAVLWKRRDREAFERSAVAFAAEACKEVRLTPSQSRLLDALIAAVGRHYGAPE